MEAITSSLEASTMTEEILTWDGTSVEESLTWDGASLEDSLTWDGDGASVEESSKADEVFQEAQRKQQHQHAQRNCRNALFWTLITVALFCLWPPHLNQHTSDGPVRRRFMVMDDIHRLNTQHTSSMLRGNHVSHQRPEPPTP